MRLHLQKARLFMQPKIPHAKLNWKSGLGKLHEVLTIVRSIAIVKIYDLQNSAKWKTTLYLRAPTVASLHLLWKWTFIIIFVWNMF